MEGELSGYRDFIRVSYRVSYVLKPSIFEEPLVAE
jgi:hypothetical protein